MKKLIGLATIIFISAFSMKLEESRIVTGLVIDYYSNAPVNDVHIVVKGTDIGTKSGPKGKFSISVPSGKNTLIFNKKHYRERTILLKNSQTHLEIKLIPAGILPVEEKLSIKSGTVKQRSKKSDGNMYFFVKPEAEGVAEDSFMDSMGFGYDELMDDEDSWNTEEYDVIRENTFRNPVHKPLSTFSIDVDAASYSNLRRVINNGQVPYKDMVRIEEMINYFSYDYKNPKGEHPFSINTEVSFAPWNKKHRLVHIGIQGKKMDKAQTVASNLVFLIDVSGSMSAANKLPLLKSSMKLLVNELTAQDRVSIVTYAGSAGLVLPPTPGTEKEKILEAFDRLKSGGSTAGGQGIKLAYKVATESHITGGNNRVILATDGDFNIGVSSTSELVRMVEEKRKSGIFLTITGFGMGNYKDGRMEQISNAGNGNYYYIDNIKEAKKVFVTDMQATLFTIAKDVKIQVEFNPTKVQAYRLIGYENRKMKAEDFNNDQKDAGELGAGHTVTALYEVIPTGVKSEFLADVDPLKYQNSNTQPTVKSSELLTVKFRYKDPNGTKSKLIVSPLNDQSTDFNSTSDDFRFSAAVAEFGMLLRESEFRQGSSYDHALALAIGSKGQDVNGYRAELIDMIRSVQLLEKSKSN